MTTPVEPDRPWRRVRAWLAHRTRMSPLVVLAVSLAATVLVTAYVWTSSSSRDRLRFESQVQQVTGALDKRLDAYVDLLIGGRGLFAASDEVTADEFTRYVEALRVDERYPGIQGIGFSSYLPVAARDSLVRAQREAGFDDFRVWPEPEGGTFHSIVFLLPQDVRNREAIGYDMSSNPVRREAMERARDTGRPSTSGRVTLVQEIDQDVQPGFLIYVPVYRGGGVPSSVAERRERLHGFVYSPFRAGDLLGALVDADAPVELTVYDGTGDDPEALLFDSRGRGGRDGEAHAGHAHELRSVVTMEIAGRPWTAAVTNGPAFDASSGRRLALLALALGLLVSAVLFFLTAAEARAHDRTDEMARALHASEAQYRLAFEANPQPMWVYDVETLGFLAANDAAVERYGYSREEFLEMTLRDIRPEEDVPRLEEYLAERSAERQEAGVWRHVTREGSVILVEVSSNPLAFAGRQTRLVLAHDVTEKVRSRAQLEEAQRRLQRILSMSTAVIYTMAVRNEELVPTWVTDNLPRITGYTVDDGLASDWWYDCIHPEDREAVVTARSELLERGQITIEYRFRHADGRYIWLRDDVVIRRDDGEAPVEAIGAWLDVTERRNLEEQVQQAQKMEAVGRLAGGIAHDFNNLLTVIRSQSDLLLLDVPPGPMAAEIELIQEAADRAAKLTSQLLAFSRDQVLRPQLVDPGRTIRDLGRLLDRVVGENITIVFDVSDDVPSIDVDPGPLEQTLMNLGVNARDAMPTGGTLTFSVAEEEVRGDEGDAAPGLAPGRYTVLRVSDTGSGMSAETRRRIFEPFFTTKPDGTGLGLAIVYGFMRQSHGGVRVESEPGRGTTFHLYFPAVEGRAPSTEGRPATGEPASRRGSGPPPGPDAPGAPDRVLLIEDDVSVRRATRRILERSGMSVVDVETAEAGLEVLEAGERFDLALTDLVLPGMSGREFVDHARTRHPELPLILMSGYEEASSTPRAELPPEVAFVPKPFTVQDLLAAVRKALES